MKKLGILLRVLVLFVAILPRAELRALVVCPSVVAPLTGVNVSQVNGPVDWNNIGAAPISFAFARVSDGTNVDSSFDSNYASIQSIGKVRGAYQLFRPSQDAAGQANLCLSKIGMLGPNDLPPALDVEVTDGLSMPEIVSGIQAWANTIQSALGRAPIIYCSASFWTNDVGSPAFSNDPLWVADWAAPCPDLPDAWLNWTFWQYSSAGPVPGIVIPITVGLNRFNGSLTDLLAMAGPPGLNHAPVLVNPIPNLTNSYGSVFSYTVPTNTFSDPDAGQTLTYTASNLPPGISFDGPNRMFSGTNLVAGTYHVTVTATDNGQPSLSAVCTFQIIVPNPPAAVCPSGTTLNGLNVSQDNGTVNWSMVAGSKTPSAFAFARVSDGTNADNQFDANYAAIRAAGMVRGAYQLLRPSQDPVAQANLCLSKIGMLGHGDLPPALDVEVTDGLSAKEVDGAIGTWIKTIQSAIGSAPIIYSSTNFWNSYVGDSTLTNNPLWVADWDVACPTLPGAWSAWKFWQYSDSGSVQGITGPVHLDQFNGGLDVLLAMTAPSNSPPIVLNPVPDQVVTDGFTYTFPANTFSDPDLKQTLSYSASNMPMGMTFDGPSRTFQGTNMPLGTYAVTLIATDNGTPPLSTTCTIHFTVMFLNHPPVLVQAIPNQTNLYGAGFSYTLPTNTFSDPDLGQTLSYTVSNLPPRITFNGSSRTFQGTNISAGIYAVTVTATDNGIPPLSTNFTFTFSIVLGSAFQQLKTFGIPSSGYNPVGPLVQGTDGMLYGTTWKGGVDTYGTVFKLKPDGTGFTVLLNFGWPPGGAGAIMGGAGGIIQATDGALYGTTYSGGSLGGLYGGGVVYKLNTDGTGLTILWNFGGIGIGVNPVAPLVQGPDGTLYGCTTEGGLNNYGTVFKLKPDGTGFTTLKRFDGDTEGANPRAALIFGVDGALYGTTTPSGGASGVGTVFKLNPDGSGFMVLTNLDGNAMGGNPEAGLVQGLDGAFYGKTISGGANGAGTVFKINADGSGFTVLRDFDPPQVGRYMDGSLIRAADGSLYGTEFHGVTNNYGSIFRLNPDGSGFAVITNLYAASTNTYSYAGLMQAADGALYGISAFGGTNGIGTLFKVNTDGTGLTVLRSLMNEPDISAEGGGPLAGLIQGTDGALYGATGGGGHAGGGTLFKLNPDGTGFTVLQHLDSSTTGSDPWAALLQGGDGALYGTAFQGGAGGYGTAFKLNTDGTGFRVLVNFDSSTTGASPLSGLVQATDGALYGTTTSGGSGGSGTVFRLNPDGTGFTVIKNLTKIRTGSYPVGLIQGIDGALYGTAQRGGVSDQGTVFRLNTDGSGASIVKSFFIETSGQSPTTPLLQGTDGALYGGVDYGYVPNVGTIFKLYPDGGFTTFSAFQGVVSAGGLIQGRDGPLYGVTTYGGIYGDGVNTWGTLFRINRNGTDFQVVFNFDYHKGAYPFGRLSQAADGNLYGTTGGGGPAGGGTLFRILIPPAALANSNAPPILAHAIPDQTNTNGQTFSYTFPADTFTDPDPGQTLTYAATNLPPGITFDRFTRTFSGTSTALGGYPVTVTATDDGTPRLGASYTFQFTVTPPPQPPPQLFTYQVLTSFGGALPTGPWPNTGLTLGADGVLYGTTYSTLFKLNRDGTGFAVLKRFTFGEGTPGARLLAAGTVLYGTTYNDGDWRFGTVFKLNTDGSGFTVLQHLDAQVTGSPSRAALIQGTDGALYGTAAEGGVDGIGTLFTLNPDGTGFTVLLDLVSSAVAPLGVVQGQDGAFYGTTLEGPIQLLGDFGHGAVFRLAPDGAGLSVLTNFNPNTMGDGPVGLIQGNDGALYGRSLGGGSGGGSGGGGTVFRLNTDGTGFSVLASFPGDDYWAFSGPLDTGLIQGSDGMLYGISLYGGAHSSVFKVGTNGTGLTILKEFNDPTQGLGPAGLLQGPDGVLYGTTTGGGSNNAGTVFRLNTDGSDYTVLKYLSLSTDLSETGGAPSGGVMQATNGIFYGVTQDGGSFGYGTLFKLNADGTGRTVLVDFDGATTGGNPSSVLLQGVDGALYGTTTGGGTGGYGTMFRLNPDGTGFTVLQNFHGGGPNAGLIQGSDGALYGTTAQGGPSGGGTVFKLNPDGSSFMLLHSFAFDGAYASPNGLLQGTDGALYGTTYQGGSFGYGTVFKLNTDGTGFAVLFNFNFLSTGAYPSAGLVQGSDGALYGTTSGGGGPLGAGLVFKLNPDGTGFQVIHYCDYATGYSPVGTMIRGSDGGLYGTTARGGWFNRGTVFRMNGDGTDFTFLGSLNDSANGQGSSASLFQGSDGNLYGTMSTGGDEGVGSVFRLTFSTLFVTRAIPAQTNSYGRPFNYVVPAGTFAEPYPGRLLTYTASNLPPGLAMDAATGTLTGTNTAVGNYDVMVTATDNGVPPLSASTNCQIAVTPAPLTVTADHQIRQFGQANPPLTGSLIGVTNGDNITASFITTATPSSPLGAYPIIPIFSDPDNRLPNYNVTTNNGTLDVTCPTNLIVTTTADSGPGSLRQAILDANGTTCASNLLISFNIPGLGVQTIAPTSALPIITSSVTIDGYTQPGASSNTLSSADNAVLLIELSGTNLPSNYGLRCDANDCTVRGLVINRFAAQVVLEYVTNAVVEGNFLGPDPTGTNTLNSVNGVLITGGAGHRVGGITAAARNVIAGDSYVGINVDSCPGLKVLGNFIGLGADGLTAMPCSWGIDLGTCSQTQIGGSAPGARNVIGGNSYGCWISGGSNNVIQGNFVGTDASGTIRRPNVDGLVLQETPNNLIGGSGPGEGNLFSGNQTGVYLDGAGASNNIIAGNLIGPDVTGTNLLGNSSYGLTIVGGPGNTVGGTSPGARNVICGNDFAGIALSFPTATGNVIQGNFIGPDVTGTNALGSGGYGIYMESSASGNLIGGTTAAARNVIARNLHGIAIVSGSNNIIRGNFIGTDATGMKGLGNSEYGLILGPDALGTLFGGVLPGAGNLVSANGYDGLQIQGTGTVIQGNLVGTDASGMNALFNGWAGIFLNDTAHYCQIGGTNAAARNIVSGGNCIGVLSSTNVIQGNYTGPGADGQTIIGVPGFGIGLGSLATGNLVGGDTFGARNVVAGQTGDGIRVAGSNNVVQGNFIGTDATGKLARGNYNNGLTLFGRNNLVGGLTVGAGNLISGNGSTGLDINGTDATGNIIQGNLIGTDATGTNALGNGNTAISIEYAPANLIGGTTPAARNVISGNGGYGLGISYDGASNNVVQGNYFGLAADGITPLPNFAGVRILSQPGNLIGGTAPGAGNWIAYNSRYGISAIGAGATNNAILGNSIFSNGWWGIDLAEDGMNPNDPGDADDGVNHLQNSPDIASASLNGGQVSIHYRVDSAAGNSAYPLTIEFFLADSFGQGKTLLYRSAYNTPQSFVDITFAPASPVNIGDALVATATDANGNTSEFSAGTIVTANHPPIVANPIPDHTNFYGGAFSYTFPTNTFADPDAGQILGYGVTGLPPGITFDGPTRTFSGTNTAAGAFAVTVTATDNGVPPLSTNDVFNFVVLDCSALAITNAALPSAIEGIAYNVTLGAANGTPPYSFSLTAGALPGNIVLAPGGALSGTPTNSGTFPVTITATGSEGCSVSSNYVLNVTCPAITVQPSFLSGTTRFFPYNQTLTASGGIAPRTFAITSGSLPLGVTLSPAGVLSGTATNAGSFTFTVTAADAGGCTGSRNYTLSIFCSAYSVVPASLPGGNVGQFYSQTFTATNGNAPYAFSVLNGDLPVGLIFSNAILSGTPTSPGTYSFAVSVVDADNCSSSVSYSVVITNNPFRSTGSLSNARAGQTATLLANGKVLITGGTAAFGAIESTELYDPAKGTWTSTGSLHVPRYNHTATLLTNGTVLAAGGDLAGTSEVYDPVTGVWTLTGNLAAARKAHTATLLANGRVLVTGGGDSSGPLNSSELYDSATGKWTVTGTMTDARWYHTATLMPNGKVLVTGGQGNGGFLAISSAELYDPVSGTWSLTGPLMTERAYHRTFLLPNGKVIAVGGWHYNGGGFELSSSEIYDPVGGFWTSGGALGTPRQNFAAALLPNGKLLVAGGSRTNNQLSGAELYDFTSGLWTPAGSLPTPAEGLTATVLAGGAILFEGGYSATSSFLAGAALYESAAGSWSTTNSLASARSGHSLTLLPNGKALAVGGFGNSGALTNAESFDPALGTWLAAGSSGIPRALHTATLLPNGLVLVAGGANNSATLSNAQLFVPALSIFTNTGSMRGARDDHTATLLANGKVLVAGGENIGTPLVTAELYDPASGLWSDVAPLSMARRSHTATLLRNGKVLIAGGAGLGTNLNSAELYDPVTGIWTATGNLTTNRNSHTATLLPNGLVLVTGGSDNNGKDLSSAELYDPNSGVWTVTGSMTTRRSSGAVAILLPNGKVLVAGGLNFSPSFNYLSAADIYDPASGTWQQTASLALGRSQLAATLLTSGKVLVAGGYNGSRLSLAELYDIGLGFDGSLQPHITTATAPLNLNANLSITGSGFRGVSEASGGDIANSPADHPVVELRSLESGQIAMLQAQSWNSNSFTSSPVTGLPSGYAMVTVFVNGIPSPSTILAVFQAPTAVPFLLVKPARLPAGGFQFFFTNTPAAPFTVLVSTNPGLSLSNWTALGPVTEGPAGQFQFTDPQATNNSLRFYRVRSP
jgi:uncharacterized repeat protein (TIGR03803 family)